MIDEDRSTWTLGQLADEVIEACALPMGCRGTIIAALDDAKDQGRAAGARVVECRDEISDEAVIGVVTAAVNWRGERAVAELLRVSLPTVRRWVRGKNLPHSALRPSLMAALEQRDAEPGVDVQATLRAARHCTLAGEQYARRHCKELVGDFSAILTHLDAALAASSSAGARP